MNVAIVVAVAVNREGRREVLGIAVMANESEAFWSELLRRHNGSRSPHRGSCVTNSKHLIATAPPRGFFEPLDLMARLAALIPKPRVNLIRYHGVFAPNRPNRAAVTPARRGRKAPDSTRDKSPAQQRAAMTWAQRLKSVFNIDIDKSAGKPICTVADCREAGGHRDVPDETCEACSGMVKMIALIDD